MASPNMHFRDPRVMNLFRQFEKAGLPVIFDDVGVNFDNDRLAAVEKAVERFAAKRQVIWFSHN